jgi:NAD+ synthase
MAFPTSVFRPTERLADELLAIHARTVVTWLVEFLRQTLASRKVGSTVVGLSGGVDSAVTAALCVHALGPQRVHCFAMPYRLSSAASLDDAHLVADSLGVRLATVDITAMVDGYAGTVADMAPARLGNICSRCRTNILFDKSAELGGIPVGTGNKTERMFGYYTWHGDDAPPVNPLGDLFKTQVWEVAKELSLPERVVAKPPTADLIPGQTDESDFGLSYHDADRILALHMAEISRDRIVELGYAEKDVDWVVRRVAGTHWKRHLPTIAMVNGMAINDSYLRPVDYR